MEEKINLNDNDNNNNIQSIAFAENMINFLGELENKKFIVESQKKKFNEMLKKYENKYKKLKN